MKYGLLFALLLSSQAAVLAQPGAPASGRFEQELGSRAQIKGLAPAEVREWNAAVERAAAVLRANSSVASPPAGLCVRLYTWMHEDAHPWAAGSATASLPVSFDGAACSELSGPGVSITLNDATRFLGGTARPEDPRQPVPQEILMLPRYEGRAGPGMRYVSQRDRWVVLTRGREPLTVPVTKERYLKHEIAQLERSRQEIAAQVPQQAGVDLERWLREDKPRMEAEFKKMLEGMRGIAPADQIESMRKNNEQVLIRQEKTMRELAARQPGGAGMQADALRRLDQSIAELRAALASLSPAERQAPACRDFDRKKPNDLGECRDSPRVARLVSMNPRYFDRSLPRSAVQLIVVSTLPHRPMTEESRRAELRWRIFESLDYAALAKGLHP